MAASVAARLRNLASELKIDFQLILLRYTTERFLYRLSISEYTKQFILKGGNLFIIWQNGRDYRPTMDADFLCRGRCDAEYLQNVFEKICFVACQSDDGVTYDVSSIVVSEIREQTEYGGTRICFNAYIGQACVMLQFDIGIGDAVTPAPVWADFPVLLNGDVPHLQTYPPATAISEKAEAMVTLGLLNSRLKDFYDIWLLTTLFEHDYETLFRAVRNTLERHHISMPTEMPVAWTKDFGVNPMKVTQWKAFRRKSQLHDAPEDFSEIVECISKFLVPVFFPPEIPPSVWKPGEGWL